MDFEQAKNILDPERDMKKKIIISESNKCD